MIGRIKNILRYLSNWITLIYLTIIKLLSPTCKFVKGCRSIGFCHIRSTDFGSRYSCGNQNKCSECGKIFCDIHYFRCSVCGKLFCGRHTSRCFSCGKLSLGVIVTSHVVWCICKHSPQNLLVQVNQGVFSTFFKF